MNISHHTYKCEGKSTVSAVRQFSGPAVWDMCDKEKLQNFDCGVLFWFVFLDKKKMNKDCIQHDNQD
jgi:hypothetical protein